VQVIKKGRLSDEKRVTERWVGILAMEVIPHTWLLQLRLS
jgi:hypothetical protein